MRSRYHSGRASSKPVIRSASLQLTSRNLAVIFLVVVHRQWHSEIHACTRALANPNVLADSNLDALIRQGAGERSGLFHSRELLGRVDIERGREDGFAVPHVVTNDFEQTQFEPVAALCPDAEIRKHEKSSIFVVVLGILQVIK
jgi:hypothetical protein